MAGHHERAVARAREGRWDEAHALVQDHDDPLSCRIHGHLHRVEGDLANARYWYRRAGVEMPQDDPEAELSRLATLASDADASGGS